MLPCTQSAHDDVPVRGMAADASMGAGGMDEGVDDQGLVKEPSLPMIQAENSNSRFTAYDERPAQV